MRYPEFLKEGDTIGFVAPAFGCTTEPYRSAFLNAQKRFGSLGFGVLTGPNCYRDDGIGISTGPEACGRELTDFYCSDKSRALLSCGGGELMCETVPFIDFERISQAAPKWYMGMSDNTNFTYLEAILCDTASVYGPNAPSFGMEPLSPCLFDTLDLLTGRKKVFFSYPFWEKEGKKDEEHPLAPYNLTEKSVIVSFPEQQAAFSGRLIGGCLDCLVNLLGTEFDRTEDFCEKYRQDGIIWFLEACDLNPMGIRRAIWQMKHAGWFSHVKGFLIGRPMHFGEVVLGLDQYRAVTDLLEEYGVPVLMDLDFGHIPPSMPLVTGAYAHVSLSGGRLSLEYEWK